MEFLSYDKREKKFSLKLGFYTIARWRSGDDKNIIKRYLRNWSKLQLFQQKMLKLEKILPDFLFLLHKLDKSCR